MKDIVDSARAAAREVAHLLGRMAMAAFWGGLFCAMMAFLVGAAYFGLRWFAPHISAKDAVTVATITMIGPAAVIGWFGILFSVELGKRRSRRENH